MPRNVINWIYGLYIHRGAKLSNAGPKNCQGGMITGDQGGLQEERKIKELYI